MTREPQVPERKHERGTSLVEVTLAMGLLAGVLGSIAGLFIVGAGQVESGRNATEALAAARSIVEETQSWGFQQLYEGLGSDGQTDSYDVDTKDSADLADWQALFCNTLPRGHATISIASLEPGAPFLADSSQLRIVVTVHWEEGTRSRRVSLGTVRM
jgi:type II secretory pathway pseudopilin PulG